MNMDFHETKYRKSTLTSFHRSQWQVALRTLTRFIGRKAERSIEMISSMDEQSNMDVKSERSTEMISSMDEQLNKDLKSKRNRERNSYP